jgi:hypothetical protein
MSAKDRGDADPGRSSSSTAGAGSGAGKAGDGAPVDPGTPATAAEAMAGRGRTDYGAAVYGSLLAASVVVGASSRDHVLPAAELTAVLLATGLVFWVAHVYAQLIGDRAVGVPLTWQEVRLRGRDEWPLAGASFPPAVAAAVVALIGGSDQAAAWTALSVAVAGQVGWAAVAAARVGASRGEVLVSAAVNLGLGVVIVALKAGVVH